MSGSGGPDTDNQVNVVQGKPSATVRLGAFHRLLGHPQSPNWVLTILTGGLALFACLAWIEARTSTAVLQGQLDILKAEDRPFMFNVDTPPPGVNMNWLPTFEPVKGQLLWNVAYKNYGKSVAYNVSTNIYIKIGNEKMQPDYIFESRAASHADVPPGMAIWGTAYSHPGISHDYIATFLNQDHGVKIIVSFQYSDASLKERYTSGFCLEHFANGSIGIHPIGECQE